jgi:hypothetical protein
VEVKAKRGAQLLEKQKSEEAKIPSCSSKWSEQEGGEVSILCTITFLRKHVLSAGPFVFCYIPDYLLSRLNFLLHYPNPNKNKGKQKLCLQYTKTKLRLIHEIRSVTGIVQTILLLYPKLALSKKHCAYVGL